MPHADDQDASLRRDVTLDGRIPGAPLDGGDACAVSQAGTDGASSQPDVPLAAAAVPVASAPARPEGLMPAASEPSEKIAPAPLRFPAAPPYPEVLLPRGLRGNLVAPVSAAEFDDASAPFAAAPSSRAELAAAGGAEEAAVASASKLPAASRVAVEGVAAATSEEPRQAGERSSGASCSQAPAGSQGLDAPQPRQRRGLAVCSVVLTIATLALLAAAALGPFPILTPVMVGVAVVGLAVAGRAAASGSFARAGFACTQFLLIAASLAGVAMILADQMGAAL